MSHYKTATALWNGQPERLPNGFTMTRSAGDYEHIAVCEAWTHPSGWELRLSIDGTSLPTTTSRSVTCGDARHDRDVEGRVAGEGLALGSTSRS